MLTKDQVELIHRESDGANTPEESAVVRALVAQDPEARALDTDLRRLSRLFNQVGTRDPPARLKQAIVEALAQPAPFAVIRSALSRLISVIKHFPEQMENAIMTKKTMLIGSAVVAVIVVVAAIVTGFPPSGAGAGT
ncbi:MAG: anti-sigma factor family protein, partial [Gemmatimonadales bacterium]